MNGMSDNTTPGCDHSGRREVSQEDEASSASEAQCIHCGGWRYRDHPLVGNWGTWTPELARRGMDVEGYERGVAGLPARLRLYAETMGGVTLTLNKEQALLLADDPERGIAARFTRANNVRV